MQNLGEDILTVKISTCNSSLTSVTVDLIPMLLLLLFLSVYIAYVGLVSITCCPSCCCRYCCCFCVSSCCQCSCNCSKSPAKRVTHPVWCHAPSRCLLTLNCWLPSVAFGWFRPLAGRFRRAGRVGWVGLGWLVRLGRSLVRSLGLFVCLGLAMSNEKSFPSIWSNGPKIHSWRWAWHQQEPHRAQNWRQMRR